MPRRNQLQHSLSPAFHPRPLAHRRLSDSYPLVERQIFRQITLRIDGFQEAVAITENRSGRRQADQAAVLPRRDTGLLSQTSFWIRRSRHDLKLSKVKKYDVQFHSGSTAESIYLSSAPSC